MVAAAEEIAAREQLPAGPPQHVGPAGGARGHRKAAQHLHDLQLWRKMVLCSPCTALHRRKRVDTSCSCPNAACPTSSVAMLMHDAMRQGEVVQHGKDCAGGAWWRQCRTRAR